MRKSTYVLAALVLALAGCPESRTDEDAGNPGTDAGPTETDAGPTETDAGPTETDAGPMDTDAGGGGLDGLVINEIDANAEWTELYNGSSQPIDLGGYRICDADDTGAPRVDRASAFPEGFLLGAGEYIVAVEAATPMVGVIATGADCDVGTRCLHTDWGISDAAGETVFLLNPSPDDSVAQMQVYPPMAAPDGDSYCRVPNATGDFAACTPTPEATNEAAP
ncbi:MAG: lamin tail domain-containing protein [Myxococcales bacterium]|nr:lamin tail domain-containing protein [Myxococcales bacterium]